jgi:uncharacterized protein
MTQKALMRRESGLKPADASATRRDVAFSSGGVTCRAWLYEPLPRETAASPCIVMAHGLGGTRECALEPYAQAFAQAGFYVLLFDYRYIGASDGEPRQVVSIPRQLEDWNAAVAFARSLPEVDPHRIGLWGTSLSGGHVVTVAARDHGIAAVSAQCPMLDGHAAARMTRKGAGWGRVSRLAGCALLDIARSLIGLSPYYVPLVAPPGGLAAMATYDAYSGLTAIVPPGWRNETAARFFLALPLYRPVRYAGAVRCPTLLIACEKDTVTSPRAVTKAAARMGANARLIELPIGHFDVYLGDGFARTSQEQVAFFSRALT